MEHVLTPEQQATIDAGVAAAHLLQDPTFNSVLNELAQSFLNGIAQTEPKEQRKREDLYFTHIALQTIHGVLRARVAAAVKLNDDLDSDAAEENLTNPAIDAGL
jgi:hypothetical protein